MKACCLGLTLSVLLPFSAAAEPPASDGQPKSGRARHETGGHHGHGNTHRNYEYPPGCATPLFLNGGYGYGGGFGGHAGISIGQSGYSPASPFNRSRVAPSRRPSRVRRARTAMSSPEARARAARHLELGDRAFRKQEYARAMGRYRKAIKAASDRAEARFRLAQAYFATGKFTQAVEAIARGLSLDPSWPESNFKVKRFYDGNELSRLAHLERLAEAVRGDRDNADLLFLLGYQLYFSGEPDRALPFFERAWDLANNQDLVLPFLQAQPRELVENLGDAPEDALPPRPSPDGLIEEREPADSTPPRSQKI